MTEQGGGKLTVRVDHARNITRLLKDKKGKFLDSFCEILIGGQGKMTKPAGNEMNELIWNEEFIFDLESLHDVQLEIRVYSLESRKEKDFRPRLMGSYITLLKTLELPKTLDSATPKWYCVYEDEGSSTNLMGGIRKKSVATLSSTTKRVAGECRLVISCDYASLTDGLRRQTMLLQSGETKDDSYGQSSGNVKMVDNAIEAKLKAAKIQIWEKKRYVAQAQKQLDQMIAALGDCPQQNDVHEKVLLMKKEIDLMEEAIGVRVLEDPRKVKVALQEVPVAEVAQTPPSGVRVRNTPGKSPHSIARYPKGSHIVSDGAQKTKATAFAQPKVTCVKAWLTSGDELSAIVGDVLTVLDATNKDWVYCQGAGGTVGYIAKDCLKPYSTMDDAESKLPLGYIPIKSPTTNTKAAHTSKIIPVTPPPIPRSQSNASVLSTSISSSLSTSRKKFLSTGKGSNRNSCSDDTEKEKLQSFIRDTSETLSDHSRWYRSADSKMNEMMEQLMFLTTRMNSGVSSLSTLPSSSPLKIQKVSRPKPNRKFTKTSTTPQEASASARGSIQSDEVDNSVSCTNANDSDAWKDTSNARLKLEMQIMESEYKAKMRDLQAQLKSKDALVLRKELELKNTLLNFFEVNGGNLSGPIAMPNIDFNLSDDELLSECEAEASNVDEHLQSTCDRLRAVKKQLTDLRLSKQRGHLDLMKNKLEEMEDQLRREMSGESLGALSSGSSISSSGSVPPPPPPPPKHSADGMTPTARSGPPPPPPPPGSDWDVKKAVTAVTSQSNESLHILSDVENLLLSKLDQLDKLDNILHKLNNLQFTGPMGGGDDPARTVEIIQDEMKGELEIIMDDTMTEKARADANIKYEKLMNELDKHPNYKQMLMKQADELEAKMRPLNKAAWEACKGRFTRKKAATDEEMQKKIAKNPELSLIDVDSKIIGNLHQNDFRQFVLLGLSSKELRAIYYVLPKFRSDQTIQIEWKDRLRLKIPETEEQEKKDALAPKVTVTPRKIVRKPMAKTGGGGNFMDELKARQERAAAGGN